MSLNKLNYSIADTVIDTYTELLGTMPKNYPHERHAYSAMNGYDIFDIKNSLNLISAYRVFEANTINDGNLNQFKEYATQDESSVMLYFMLFMPDSEKEQIDGLDKNHPEFLLNSVRLKSNPLDSEIFKRVQETESCKSFLDFCLATKGNPKYWELVYKKLGLDYETREEYDKIYFEIKLEQKRQESINELLTELDSLKVNEQSIHPIQLEENKVVDQQDIEDIIEAERKSFYQTYKTEIFNLAFILILILSINQVVIRSILFLFLFLLNVFLIVFSWRESLFETKLMRFQFAMNIISVVVLSIGLFSPFLGVYSTLFLLTLHTFDLFRSLLKGLFRKPQ